MQQQHVKGVDAQTGAAVKQPMLPSWFSFDPDFGMLDGGIKTLKMMVGGLGVNETGRKRCVDLCIHSQDHFWEGEKEKLKTINALQHELQVLLDLGLSDKAATIDLRQLSLLINDEIIQSQVIKIKKMTRWRTKEKIFRTSSASQLWLRPLPPFRARLFELILWSCEH